MNEAYRQADSRNKHPWKRKRQRRKEWACRTNHEEKKVLGYGVYRCAVPRAAQMRRPLATSPRPRAHQPKVLPVDPADHCHPDHLMAPLLQESIRRRSIRQADLHRTNTHQAGARCPEALLTEAGRPVNHWDIHMMGTTGKIGRPGCRAGSVAPRWERKTSRHGLCSHT